MIRLNILNMNNFLKEIDACKDPVYLIHEDGKRENIKQRFSQNFLRHNYEQNHYFLKIKLEIPNPGDYFRIVSYYAGDC